MSCPCPTPPSRKRLLSDCPKPQTPLASPPLKKTRDLPNLTECHACGSRTDAANGKNRIQTLYSEWRIVLLCKKCLSRVESSRICSYCFGEASGDCFSCGQCKRSVHKSCFFKYKSVAPWSYSSAGSEFSVCVDCWVPEHLARRRRLSRRSWKSGKSPRVSDDDVTAKSLEDAFKDANCVVEKNVEAAARAREMAVQKAVVARQAVELATNALELVSQREECDDDTELAYRLHLAMNGSRRISKNRDLNMLKPIKMVYLRRPKNDEGKGNVEGKMGLEDGERKCIVYKRHRKHSEKCGIEMHMEEEERSYTGYESCRQNVDMFSLEKAQVEEEERNCIVYARRKKCGKKYGTEMQQNGEERNCIAYTRRGNSGAKCVIETQLKDGVESCFSEFIGGNGNGNGINSESKYCHHQDSTIVYEGAGSNGNPDPYLLKYCRKKPNSEGSPDVK